MALSLLALVAGFALQPTGLQHAGEPIARDGERWLALRTTDGAATLASAIVHVRPAHDPIVDEPPAATGLEVTIDGGDAVVLLRGPGLLPGVVDSAGAAALAPITRSPLGMELGGRDYRVSLRCDRGAPDTPRPCRIVLEAGTQTQSLLDITATESPDGDLMLGDDASPRLWFAGDLDRDGRLDLILDTADHYNVTRPTLLLSSQARPGELVREVAVHESVGC